MAEKLTTLQQIKKLDEERAKLLESAKADALARAEEAVNELTALGFDFELVEPARATARKTKPREKSLDPITTRKGRARSADRRPTLRMISGLINRNKRSGHSQIRSSRKGE